MASPFTVDFKDITLINRYMTAKIGLAKFNGRFRRAQIWVDRFIMDRMQPFVPYKTGVFLGKINAENAGKWGTGEIVTAVPPQGKRLYPGVTESGKPFKWTNPQTQPYWGEYTYNLYKKEINDGIKHILLTGRYKDG